MIDNNIKDIYQSYQRIKIKIKTNVKLQIKRLKHISHLNGLSSIYAFVGYYLEQDTLNQKYR